MMHHIRKQNLYFFPWITENISFLRTGIKNIFGVSYSSFIIIMEIWGWGMLQQTFLTGLEMDRHN